VIAKVVALNLFALFFCIGFVHYSWLHFCMALCIVIALYMSLFPILKERAKSKGKLLLSPLRARKSNNYIEKEKKNQRSKEIIPRIK
jgi:hypothetical protein